MKTMKCIFLVRLTLSVWVYNKHYSLVWWLGYRLESPVWESR